MSEVTGGKMGYWNNNLGDYRSGIDSLRSRYFGLDGRGIGKGRT